MIEVKYWIKLLRFDNEYFWPSALIREYVAIHREKKRAIIFVIGWIICLALVFYGWIALN